MFRILKKTVIAVIALLFTLVSVSFISDYFDDTEYEWLWESGEISKSEVRTISGKDGEELFAFEVKYFFEFEDKTYVGRQVNRQPANAFVQRKDAEQLAERFAKGRKTKVYFRAADPKECFLDKSAVGESGEAGKKPPRLRTVIGITVLTLWLWSLLFDFSFGSSKDWHKFRESGVRVECPKGWDMLEPEDNTSVKMDKGVLRFTVRAEAYHRCYFPTPEEVARERKKYLKDTYEHARTETEEPAVMASLEGVYLHTTIRRDGEFEAVHCFCFAHRAIEIEGHLLRAQRKAEAREGARDTRRTDELGQTGREHEVRLQPSSQGRGAGGISARLCHIRY